jgi:hypothetical protein
MSFVRGRFEEPVSFKRKPGVSVDFQFVTVEEPSAFFKDIRSLAYFQPVMEELLEHPVPGGYLQYLRIKLRGTADNPTPAKVQKFGNDVGID